MPYYRHLKETIVELPTDLEPYATMVAARDGINVKTEVVTFVSSAHEQREWIMREFGRMTDGTYLAVPWHVSSYADNRPENIRYHFAHLSLKSPGLVAYTKNDEHGVNDRQTAVKPGKYLAEFYAGEFSDERVQEYIAQCSVTAQAFKLATSEADITSIFGRTDCGFTSCMQSKRSPEYDWDRAFQRGDRLHPCAVYAESDLAIAYLGDLDGKITARVVVWPERKLINLRSDGTVYGDQTLKHILLAAGYTVDGIHGARVRLLKNHNGIIFPYVDNFDWANPSADGKWVVLDDIRGPKRLTCSNHETGYGDSGTDDCDRDNDDDYNEDADRYTCEHCNYRFDCSDMDDNSEYCRLCFDRSNYCDKCETRHWRESEDVGSESWCDRCVNAATLCCENPIKRREGVEPCGETWIEVGEFTSAECAIRIDHHTSHLCRKCAEGVQSCVSCAALFDSTAMQCDCGHTVRCEHTSALPLEPDLLVGADGSMWWQAVGQHEDRTRFWAIVNGARHHTYAPAFVLAPSEFNTLDHLEHYLRVPDPRPEASF